jgi:hypothetical protein
MMRKIFSLFALGLASCSSADLRPQEWRSAGPPAAARSAGEDLLGVMRVAHGFPASARTSPKLVRTPSVRPALATGVCSTSQLGLMTRPRTNRADLCCRQRSSSETTFGAIRCTPCAFGPSPQSPGRSRIRGCQSPS